MPRHRLFTALAVLCAVGYCAGPSQAQQGISLSGVGAINRSMGGASTAAPIDAAGALYWNPATISGLPRSEIEFGLEFLYPRSTLSSTVGAGAFGPLGPPVTLAGTTSSNSGVFPLPTLGLVYRPDGSSLTLGLGIFSTGGLAVNYPGSLTNPLLTAQPPQGVGLGPVTSDLEIIQIAPAVSWQVTPQLSIGISPMVDLGHFISNPDIFSPPDDANGDGFTTFRPGTNTRFAGGLGVQAGAYFTTDLGWNFGVSVKSPQWFEPYRFNSTDELGRPLSFKVHLNYPMIVSVGTSWKPMERLLLAADVRYYDYQDTEGFSTTGYDTAGAVRGLGWKSIYAVAVGSQYQMSDQFSVRLGYVWNTNPIDNANTVFNVASPNITQNAIFAGFSFQPTSTLVISLAYSHAFENSISGPIILPSGPVPQTSVRSTLTGDLVVGGITVKF